MSTSTLPDTAKVFMSGRSQAVRLPKAYRFDTDEVPIEKVKDGILLRPKPDTHEAWFKRVVSILEQFDGMPDVIERDCSPVADDIESFD